MAKSPSGPRTTSSAVGRSRRNASASRGVAAFVRGSSGRRGRVRVIFAEGKGLRSLRGDVTRRPSERKLCCSGVRLRGGVPYGGALGTLGLASKAIRASE